MIIKFHNVNLKHHTKHLFFFIILALNFMQGYESQGAGYSSSSVTQITGNVLPGSGNQQIIVVTVNGSSSGFLQNWQIASCSFTLNNSNNADVTSAKLWINSTNNFATATQTGTTINNPVGNINFTINSGNIGNSSRYLFLSYDISSTAPCNGNSVDALVTANGLVITGNGSGNKTPVNNDPSGARPIFNSVTPSILIAATGNGVCEGGTITFNATISSGGAAPLYQWKVNGQNAGTNADSFSTSTLTGGEIVTCTLTSDAACANPLSVQSNGITVTVFSNPKPKVIPPDTVLCAGSFLTIVTRDTGAYSGGYPSGTLFDYGFSPMPDSTFFVNGNGNYAVTVYLPAAFGSCSATSAIPNISFIDAPFVEISADTVSCHGETDATIYAQVFLGTIPFHYKWYHNGLLVKDTISSEYADTLKNLGAGIYCMVVSDSIAGNNSTLICASDSACIEIIQPDQLLISVAYSDVLCLGGSDGAIDITVSGGVPPFQYVWSNGQTVEDINLLPIGTYIVTVTDLNGCIASETIVIQTASDTIAPVINCPSNIETNTDISSCNAIVNYTAPMVTDNCPWVNTLQITGLPSGSAFPIGQTINTFIATDTSGNSSTCSFTVTVTEQEFPVITCSSDILVYAVSGSCDAVVNFPPTIASDNCSAGPVIQTGGFSSGSSFPVGTTTNTFTVSDNSGNGSTCSFNVTVMDTISPVIACIGDTVLVNNTGQYGTFFSYSLSYSDNCTHSLTQTSGLSSGSFFPVGTTLNTFVVTDSSGNSATCSFNVIVIDNEPPVALCQNISLILDPNGTILVDPAMIDAGSQDNSGSISRTVVPSTFNCSQTGINLVELTVSDIHGNSSNCFATVTISSSLTCNISPDPAELCSGNSLTLSANPSGGSGIYASHQWTGNGGTLSDTTIENPIYTGQSAGNYMLFYTLTDNQGCQAADTLLLEVYPALSASVSQTDVNCFGGNDGQLQALVTGGSGNVNYLWNTGETTSSVSGKDAGTYQVTITDVAGCTVTLSNTITEPEEILLTTTSTPSGCGGISDGTATAIVSGGVAGYSYLWTDGQTTLTAIGLAPGIYTVTVTDAHNCQETASATISPLTIDISLSTITYNGGFQIPCNGSQNGIIDLNVQSGQGPFTYAWSNGASTEDLSGIPAGLYSVTITNGFCTSSGSLILTEPAALTLNSTSTNVTCFGKANGTGSVIAIGGVQPFNYLWNTDPVKTTSEINALPPGSFTVLVTDANGCTQNSSLTITQPSAISVGAVVTNLKCKGDSDGAIDITASGGIPPYNYNWSNGFTTQDLTGLKSKPYIVTVTDENGCLKKTTFNVTGPNTYLQLLTNKTTVRCYGGNTGSASVSAVGGGTPYQYAWNTIPVKTTSSISNLSAGIYICTVTDAFGCIKTAVFNINEPPLLVLTTSFSNVTTPGGNNGSASVSASGGTPQYNYLWYTVPVATTAGITNLTAGTYTVRVTDKKGCSKTAVVTITQPPSKQADIYTKDDGLIRIFPNPSQGRITVNIENRSESEFDLKLIDLLGNRVYQDKLLVVPKIKNAADYNFGHLPKGIYFLELTGINYRKTLKVILD